MISPNAPSYSSSRTSAAQIFKVLLPSFVYALGQGLNPLIKRSISTADLVKSIFPKSFVIIFAYSVVVSPCFSGVTSPFSMSSMVSTQSFAPAALNLSNKEPPVSSLSNGTTTFVSISPVSRPSSICIMVTPVSFKPSTTAH